MRRLPAALLLLAAACYVGPPRYYQPPPRAAPPPAQRMLTEQEAIGVAMGHARAHGVEVSRVKHAHLDGAGRWHVELRGDRGRDRARVLVDAWTGQVVKAVLRDED